MWWCCKSGKSEVTWGATPPSAAHLTTPLLPPPGVTVPPQITPHPLVTITRTADYAPGRFNLLPADGSVVNAEADLFISVFNDALQSQKAVTAYFKSKQLLLFGFARYMVVLADTSSLL